MIKESCIFMWTRDKENVSYVIGANFRFFYLETGQYSYCPILTLSAFKLQVSLPDKGDNFEYPIHHNVTRKQCV